MGDEEPAAEPAAAEPEVVVSPRPVPAEEGAVTAAEIGAWCGMSSAAERMASVARRLGATAHDEDVLRDFYQWNLQFVQDAGLGPAKGAVVFQLLKEQRDEAVGQELPLDASLASFQRRLLEASKAPPAPSPQPAAEPEAAPADDEAAAADGEGDAAAEAEGGDAAEPPAAAAAAEAATPPALAVGEVKLVTDYFLRTFYRHYELHQAVFGASNRQALAESRAPVQVRSPHRHSFFLSFFLFLRLSDQVLRTAVPADRRARGRATLDGRGSAPARRSYVRGRLLGRGARARGAGAAGGGGGGRGGSGSKGGGGGGGG